MVRRAPSLRATRHRRAAAGSGIWERYLAVYRCSPSVALWDQDSAGTPDGGRGEFPEMGREASPSARVGFLPAFSYAAVLTRAIALSV
jgi:hypothetical protein